MGNRSLLSYVFILLCSIFFATATFADEYIEDFCNQYSDEIVHSYKCPKSGLVIPFTFCVIKQARKPELFFDGCTGPTGGHTELFYPYCIAHDFCYHREPATNGKTQKMCDDELLKGLLYACESTDKVTKCRNWAKIMHRAVRMFGALAYNCANIDEKN